MDSQDEFYITLFSNDNLKLFPENTLASFENKLPNHFDLRNGNWKVGLSEIYLNDFLQTEKFNKENCALINIGEYNVYVTNIEKPLEKIKVTKSIGYTYYSYDDSELHLNDWKFNFLPTLIKNITPNPGYTRNQVFKEFFNEILAYISNTKNYDEVTFQKVADQNKKGLIRISQTFDEDSFFIKVNHTYNIQTLLKELFQQKKGIKNFKTKLPELFKLAISNHKDELNGMVMIYSDIVQSSIFGSNQVRALRAINIENCRIPINIEFQNIHYIPIEKNIFETIAIKICNQYGDAINFVSSYFPTKIVLHFKKH